MKTALWEHPQREAGEEISIAGLACSGMSNIVAADRFVNV